VANRDKGGPKGERPQYGWEAVAAAPCGGGGVVAGTIGLSPLPNYQCQWPGHIQPNRPKGHFKGDLNSLREGGANAPIPLLCSHQKRGPLKNQAGKHTYANPRFRTPGKGCDII